MNRLILNRLLPLYILATLCVLSSVANGQGFALPIPDGTSKEWRRINTGQDSTTDVGVSTLILEPNGLFRATYRISLSKSEEAAEKPGAKYKARLLTIQFDSRKTAYRIYETSLLDSSDKIVYASEPNPASKWKPLVRTSSTYYTYYSAASNLSPLGLWKVTSSSDAQATATTGRTQFVATALDRFQVAGTTCSLPDYESAAITREELAKLTGLALNNLDLTPEKVNVVKIKCASSTLTSEIHVLIPRAVDRAILLSGGTLYALEK